MISTNEEDRKQRKWKYCEVKNYITLGNYDSECPEKGDEEDTNTQNINEATCETNSPIVRGERWYNTTDG